MASHKIGQISKKSVAVCVYWIFSLHNIHWKSFNNEYRHDHKHTIVFVCLQFIVSIYKVVIVYYLAIMCWLSCFLSYLQTMTSHNVKPLMLKHLLSFQLYYYRQWTFDQQMHSWMFMLQRECYLFLYQFCSKRTLIYIVWHIWCNYSEEFWKEESYSNLVIPAVIKNICQGTITWELVGFSFYIWLYVWTEYLLLGFASLSLLLLMNRMVIPYIAKRAVK